MFKPRPNQARALDDMTMANIGQVIMTTGGGKTLCMIQDAIRHFESDSNATIVVVAPRLLLANQLCSEFLEFILDANVFHVHSGETRHHSSTDSMVLAAWAHLNPGKKLIFTTYHSLHRVQESDIEVDAIYFDEAHNSVKRSFFESTSYFSDHADRCFFFTATPRHSKVSSKPGMNDSEVYGEVLHHTSAPELVAGGFIVPPQVQPMLVESTHSTADDIDFTGLDEDQIDAIMNKIGAERDSNSIINVIDEKEVGKVLVCAKSTKQIIHMMRLTDFQETLADMGYSTMYITSKTGPVIDNRMVDRELFFDTLNKWGKDPDKKFVVLHYSILSEGINVSGLEGVIFMRGMNNTGICQTIGRVIRMNIADATALRSGELAPGDFDNYVKPFGIVMIPVYSMDDKFTKKIIKAVQSVVDTSFNRGEMVITQ
jgi:superfamily II DNA or RNA helicase